MALTPIARWNYVPYQRITAATKIGVVAFSKAGISSVAISWNGAVATTVTLPTYNSDSNTWEYWAIFYPSAYALGTIVTLDATVTGGDGGVRVLPQMTVIADSSGNWQVVEAWVDKATGNDSTGAVNDDTKPFLTMGKAGDAIRIYRNAQGWGNNANGGIIRLLAGNQETDNGGFAGVTVNEDWLTITSAAGVPQSAVVLGAKTNLPFKYLHVEGITLQHNGNTDGVLSAASGANPGVAWLQDVIVNGSSRYIVSSNAVGSGYGSGTGIAYYVDSSITDTRWGCLGAVFARGMTITTTADDAFQNCPCIINCTADDLNPGITGYHTDAMQYYNAINDDNVIIYNYKATNLYYQGMFWRGGVNNDTPSDGGAFVNVMLEANAAIVGGIWASYRSIDQWVMHHCTVVMSGGRCSFSEEPDDAGTTDMPEMDVRGCSLPAVLNNISTRLDTTDWYDNRYGDDSGTYITPGSRYTVGDPDLDANGAPNSGSPLESAMVRLTGVPADINGDVRSGVTAIGAYRGKDEAGIIQPILIRTREKAKRI